MPYASTTPVLVAEEILQLAKSAFSEPSTNTLSTSPETYDPLVLHTVKIQLQDLCDKLLQSVLGRQEYTVLLAESCQESSALGFVTRLGIPDIIGNETVSLAELSAKTAAEEQFLGVAMSCLSKHNYFEEAGGFGTRIYRNNHLSEILKDNHPESVKDAVGFICDEGLKATGYLLEASKLPTAQKLPAVNLAYGFKKSIFEWMSDNAWRGQRMGKAMQQLHRMANGNVTVDFPWNTLDSPIIDIGGGIGSLEMALMKDPRNGSLKFTIFDIPKTIEHAKKTWNSQPSDAASCVSFVSGNFLAPTLEETCIPKGKPTYLIRHVLHDWTDDQVVEILTNIRGAMLANADSKTQPKLILCEMLLRDSSSRFVRTTSMQLLVLNNGITRTEADMVRLVERSGFKVESIHYLRAVDSIVEAIPV